MIVLAALILAANISPALAQSPNEVNPPTSPQTAPMTAAEQQNLDMVLNWWREVIEAHHTELAEKYQAEDYIQHNPNVPTGRAAFVKFFSTRGPVITPIPEKLKHQPVVKGAKGDLVWLIFENQQRDPRDPTKTYHFNSFDVLRIQNGKVQEHWDSAKKFPGSPTFIPSTAEPRPSGTPPSSPVKSSTTSASPQKN